MLPEQAEVERSMRISGRVLMRNAQYTSALSDTGSAEYEVMEADTVNAVRLVDFQFSFLVYLVEINRHLLPTDVA